MSTAVRLAQPTDAEGISQVILAALHSSNARDYPADVIARVASNFTPDAVLALLKRRVVLVAIEDQRVVATAALDANVVRSVFVNPTLQGQGIGRLLMMEIELRAREAGVTVFKCAVFADRRAVLHQAGVSHGARCLPWQRAHAGDGKDVVIALPHRAISRSSASRAGD